MHLTSRVVPALLGAGTISEAVGDPLSFPLRSRLSRAIRAELAAVAMNAALQVTAGFGARPDLEGNHRRFFHSSYSS